MIAPAHLACQLATGARGLSSVILILSLGMSLPALIRCCGVERFLHALELGHGRLDRRGRA